EDVDAVLRGGGNEAADELGLDRARADEEAAAQRHPERRLDTSLECAQPFPRALDPAPDGTVEDAAAGDLEVLEAALVEDFGDVEQLGGRQPPGERILSEQPNRRVGERRHAGTLATHRNALVHGPRLEQ